MDRDQFFNHCMIAYLHSIIHFSGWLSSHFQYLNYFILKYLFKNIKHFQYLNYFILKY